MSYFDDASLVMIPSGYKTSKVYSVKPTDGSGDLTFSRSNDTATRVNSAGLIEKVRTNILTNSQAFDLFPTNAGGTVNANATTAPDGTTTADRLNMTSTGSSGLYQVMTVVSGVEYSQSIYIKNDSNATNIRLGSDSSPSTAFVDYNAVTGTIVATGGAITQSSVTDAGNGWKRISLTYNSTGTTNSFIVYNISGSAGSVFLWGGQVETGVTTAYIATTSAAVSVGPVANVPRLDYLNSSCPRLLLEPQRTSLVTFSESFNNAAWGDAGITITANQAVSPDGYTNADLAVNSSSVNYLYQGLGSPFSGTYTVSIFAKKGSQSSFAFGMVAGGFTGGMGVKFNFDTQTFSTPTNYGNFTSMSASYQSYGNGWYRLSLRGTTATSTTYFFVLGSLQESFAVNAYVYGAQVEAGAYATSYIPTLGAAVTRGADACSKTGISSLTSASEYTIYWEGTHIPTGEYNSFATFYNTANNNDSVRFYRNNTDNQIRAAFFNSATGLSLDLASGVTTQTAKCAMRVKAGSYALYVNGVLVNSSTSALAPASNLNAVNLQYFSSGQSFDQKTGQVLFFKTALSNADLAALTA